MEYRRRKRRRVPQGGGAGGGNATAKTIVALIVIAAIVYVVSASTVGTWIAQKVIAPAFAAFDSLMQPGLSVPAATPGEGGLNIPPEGNASVKDTVTGDISIPPMEYFALQMGVYSDKSNAEKEASSLRQRGAGGYVMEEGGKYRVLAAVYALQDSLKQVREQLTAEGTESAAYVFSAPNSTLRVTAPQSQLDGLTSGFEALMGILEDMAEETLAFDKDRKTAAQGRETAKKLLTTLQSAKVAFEAASTVEHPILDAAKSCFSEYEAALQDLSKYETESFVDFSSKMKYTHICMVHAYAKLADRVSTL